MLLTPLGYLGIFGTGLLAVLDDKIDIDREIKGNRERNP